MDSYYKLSSLLESSSFLNIIEKGLDKTHDLVSIVSDIKLMKHSDKDIQTLGRIVAFLRKHEKEWTEKNIKSKYDINEFNNNCDKVATKYPLLHNISSSTYSYRNYEEDNFGKNIVDYVLMCDLM